MKYTNSSGVTIEILPWSDSGYKLDQFTLRCSLGGDIAGGKIILNGVVSSEEANQAQEECIDGTVTIEKEGRESIEFSYFITNRNYLDGNLVLDYVSVSDPKYFRDKIKMTYKGTLDSILTQLYPDIDIRCSTDIQGELTFHQNNISNIELFSKLAPGYRRNVIFGFLYDKFLIKDTCNQEELDNAKAFLATKAQLSTTYGKKYNAELYTPPFNAWESPEKNGLGEDYSDRQPRFIRSIQKRGETSYVNASHAQLYENSMINKALISSYYFHRQKVSLTEWPEYAVGDVLIYDVAENTGRDVSWPHKYYLVTSMSMFMAGSGSKAIAALGKDFSIETTFVGLEEDGSIALDREEGEDPSRQEEEREPVYYRENDEEPQSLPKADGSDSKLFELMHDINSVTNEVMDEYEGESDEEDIYYIAKEPVNG